MEEDAGKSEALPEMINRFREALLICKALQDADIMQFSRLEPEPLQFYEVTSPAV